MYTYLKKNNAKISTIKPKFFCNFFYLGIESVWHFERRKWVNVKATFLFSEVHFIV